MTSKNQLCVQNVLSTATTKVTTTTTTRTKEERSASFAFLCLLSIYLYLSYSNFQPQPHSKFSHSQYHSYPLFSFFFSSPPIGKLEFDF